LIVDLDTVRFRYRSTAAWISNILIVSLPRDERTDAIASETRIARAGALGRVGTCRGRRSVRTRNFSSFFWKSGFDRTRVRTTPEIPAPVTVGSDLFRNRLGEWLERAAAGQEILVTYRGRPRVRLGPAT
jgi:prevent-host-death family protein